MEILCCSFVHLFSLNFIPSLFNLKDSFICGESDYSQEYWYNRILAVYYLLDWTIEPIINGEATGWMICWRSSCCTESRPPNPTNFHASKTHFYLFFLLPPNISQRKRIILQNVPYQRLGNVSLSFAFKSVLSHQLLTDFAISSQRGRWDSFQTKVAWPPETVRKWQTPPRQAVPALINRQCWEKK